MAKHEAAEALSNLLEVISELRAYFSGSFIMMVISDRKILGGQTLCLIHLLSLEPRILHDVPLHMMMRKW